MDRHSATMPFAIERAGLDESTGQYRVSGIMNSFRVMSSGRLLHPAGFQKWRAASPQATLPMYANHAWGKQADFASIGRWDGFEFTERGMLWHGWVGEGTPLADQARTLLKQRLLDQLSLDWEGQARVVHRDAPDVDEYVAAALDSAGAKSARVFFDWEPFGGSLVDAADDAHARLVAGPEHEDLDTLRREVAELRAVIETARGSAEVAAVMAGLGEAFTDWVQRFQLAALEALESGEVRDAAAIAPGLAEDARFVGAGLTGATAGNARDTSALLERLREGR